MKRHLNAFRWRAEYGPLLDIYCVNSKPGVIGLRWFPVKAWSIRYHVRAHLHHIRVGDSERHSASRRDR